MYLFFVILPMLLGLAAQGWIDSSFKRWKEVRISTGLTGSQTARAMLDAQGLHDVHIKHTKGDLSDYYDPEKRTLYLSEESYEGTSVASVAVACHEAGHAVQHAKHYLPIKWRNLVLPFAQIGSNIWMFILLAGMFFRATGLITLGIVLFSLVVIFQIVTLPVEFDASRRALALMQTAAPMTAEEQKGARRLLTAAALTYVVGALISLMQLLYLMRLSRD